MSLVLTNKLQLKSFSLSSTVYETVRINIKPNHNGINEYLGELYVQTNRIDKANERLEVLKNCNCKEYGELELIIKTRGTKIY